MTLPLVGPLFGALKSDSTHHFFRNACTKSGSLQFSSCWLILSVDENDLFVELDNNKQVEYRVKSPKFLYYICFSILLFKYQNLEIL
jgi:hypothetical protein